MAYHTGRRTPTSLEQAIEQALRPGHFIDYHAGWSFVSGLETVAAQIAVLIEQGHPECAVILYELFIAGCYEKAEELDDSSGEYGAFVEGLFAGWLRAREAASADLDETAAALLHWIDDDPYGFCAHLERQAVTAFTAPGLAAFAQAVRVRLEEAETGRFRTHDMGARYQRNRWQDILKAIYAVQQNVEAYLSLCAGEALTLVDCEVVAGLYQQRGEPDTALAWVDRGLQREAHGHRGASFGLRTLQRTLLRSLGRAREALQLAWQDFQTAPSTLTYKTLMEGAPESERTHWHAQAMQAAEQGMLSALIPLWLETQEVDRLVERVRRTDEAALIALSHSITEPAAVRLATSHPEVAATLYRALGLRILTAKKSTYYSVAVSHFAQARHCYAQAGLDGQWEALVETVRRTHGRKYGFMPAFERMVAGQPPRPEVSFLARAQQRWRRPGPH